MTSTARGFAVLFSTCLLVAASASSALAAGYDTPILYSARHMGMGGTAIGYVNDPSAVFHNPAGFAHVKKASTLIDISFLTGHIQAVPSNKWEGYNDGVNGGVTSEPVIAPAFLLGGSYRINDVITAGFGFYPLASAGGGYEYNNVLFTGADPTPIKDTTRLVLLEASPVLAFNLPGNLRLGVGYRIGYAMLDRDKSKVDSDEPAMLGLSGRGTNLEGIRVGLQWTPDMIEGLEVGVVFRSGIEAIMEGEANLGELNIPEVETSLALAPKLGAGLRYAMGDYAVAFDAEYTWSSWETGEVQEIVGQMYVDGVDEAIGEKTLNNVMLWDDGLTLRGGLEMRFAEHWFARGGYIYDGKVGNEVFPSAFGTPPTPTQTFTVGTGYSPGPWSVNFAYAMRQGGVTITPEDAEKAEGATLADGSLAPDCDTCGFPGDYEIVLHGIYIDFSYEWGVEDESPAGFEATIAQGEDLSPPTTAARNKPAPATRQAAKSKPAPAARQAAKSKPAPATRRAAKSKPAPATRRAAKSKPAPATRQAAKGKLLAVLGFKSDRSAQLGSKQVEMLTDYVRQLTLKTARQYKIMTQENMEVLLKSHGTTLAKCAEAECAVEFGRKIGADLLVSGSLSKLGSYLFLNLRAHDTAEGVLLAAETVKSKDIDGLVDGLDAAVTLLLGGL